MMFQAYLEAGWQEQQKLKQTFPFLFGAYKDEIVASGVDYTKGDRSVGMMPQEYTFTLHRACLEDPASREFFRKEFQQLYREATDEIAFVVFDDESVDEESYYQEGLHSKQVKANMLADQEIAILKKAQSI